MKRKNRDINIFSMSALDLFASALGAFILLAVVVFPYFPNIGMVERAELDEVTGQLEGALGAFADAAGDNAELNAIRDELEEGIRDLRGHLADCQARVQRLEGELETTRDRLDACEAALQDMGALKVELDNALDENGILRGQIDNLTGQVDNLTGQVDDLTGQIGNMTGENEELHALIARLRGQIDNLNGQVDNLNGQIGALTGENQDLSDLVENLRGQIEELRNRIAELERRKFLFVTISWQGTIGDDVDLHVVDPSGNEYYWAERSYTGNPARFEEDSLDGPGNEVWLQPAAIPGDYQIYYNPYALTSGTIAVRGRIVSQGERHEFRERQLVPGGSRQLVATVTVDDDGNLTVIE